MADNFDRIMSKLDYIEESLAKKEALLKKNAHLHIMIPSEILEEIRSKAHDEGISMAEWSRKKLISNSQLDRIEGMLRKIIKEKS